MFGVSYISSSLAGVASIDLADDPSTNEEDEERMEAYGKRMLIPIIGPWSAIGKADTATGAWFTGLAGVVQGVGFGLATAGIIRLSRAHRRKVQRYSVGASSTQHGGTVMVSGRF